MGNSSSRSTNYSYSQSTGESGLADNSGTGLAGVQNSRINIVDGRAIERMGETTVAAIEGQNKAQKEALRFGGKALDFGSESLDFGSKALDKSLGFARSNVTDAFGFARYFLQSADEARTDAMNTSERATKNALEFAHSAAQPDAALMEKMGMAFLVVGGLVVVALIIRRGK